MQIPTHGKKDEQIMASLEAYREGDVPWRGGKTFGYIYHAGQRVETIAKRAFNLFMSENALDPTVYPSLLRLENDIVAMCVAHLRGGPDTVGSFTSGGTESILLAVKAAREYAATHKPHIQRPKMILPETAHAAFHKAAHYFGLEVVPVDVHPETFEADVEQVRAAIDEDTILLVGSAPSYAHGVIDPIDEMGQIASEHGLLFHVDACIGGFLLPYFRRLGEEVRDFDFQVDGVTSISMDLHKYAYAPKGASVVLYRNAELRQHQIFACAKWSGYSVVNPTVQSTKSGGPLAGAWAVLHALGDDGYLAIARDLRDATRKLVEGIEAIDGLQVLGNPVMSLLAFTSSRAGVFHVVDEMKARGWYVQAQLAFGQSPANIHLTVAPSNVVVIDELLTDLTAAVEDASQLPSGALASAVEGALAGLDESAVNAQVVSSMLAMAGVQGAQLPARMAEINELLNTLTPGLREALIKHFMQNLFRPTQSGDERDALAA